MTDVAIHLEGNHVRSTSQRARIDPIATVTIWNDGPAVLEHSASADGSTPTTIAAGASGTITTLRYLRSQGRSYIRTDGRLDAYVATA
jgi:hypothetical protein